ncbi:hypothetical protein A2U01_0001799 [Trifolium medium]|uniref:Uncharacterized protein n=1 Tax=Trifolium medium TaxID=97028 RepID=A0A392M168_9FABA|nr:hypothetical protein [Trifolium medium]
MNILTKVGPREGNMGLMLVWPNKTHSGLFGYYKQEKEELRRRRGEHDGNTKKEPKAALQCKEREIEGKRNAMKQAK